MKKEQEQGVCPACGKETLSYEALKVDGDQICYPWYCENCQSEGKEWYKLTFIEHIMDINALRKYNMTEKTKEMLEALRNTRNLCTKQHVIEILEGKSPVFSTKSSETLAIEGRLGDFLQAVMDSDLTYARACADTLNLHALRNLR